VHWAREEEVAEVLASWVMALPEQGEFKSHISVKLKWH